MTERRKHFIYLHRNAEGIVIYVGCTVNVEQRTRQHQSSARWWPEVASIEVASTVFGRSQAFIRERQLIAQYEPAYNLAANPGCARRLLKEAVTARPIVWQAARILDRPHSSRPASALPVAARGRDPRTAAGSPVGGDFQRHNTA